MSAVEPPSGSEQEYFRHIEEIFIGLRGAPFLLSPADWHLAQGWYERGIPVDVVQSALETVFERRAERGAEGKVQSLRYCAAAVESAWRERLELGVAQPAGGGESIDVEARLGRLAEALPDELERRADWQARIRRVAGTAKEAEDRLADLDRELTTEILEGLDPTARRRLEAEVDRALAGVRKRLAPDVLEADRRRLMRETARRRGGLPLLSLFAPEASGD